MDIYMHKNKFNFEVIRKRLALHHWLAVPQLSYLNLLLRF